MLVADFSANLPENNDMIAFSKMFLAFAVVLIVIPVISFCQGASHTKTSDGVIIYPEVAGQTKAVKIQVIKENIIRVIASPEKEFPAVKSLIISHQKEPFAQWELVPGSNGKELTIKTKSISGVADLKTGRVVFYDAAGKTILAERQTEERLDPVVVEGERTYSVHQRFETTANDAWYGLGQHQDGLMNYKGYQVFLFQNNTEVAVPFLISKKNYGILWDNNSITKAGDTRSYHDLSALKLFSKENQPGWLTATYYNDRKKPGEALMQRAESGIKL